MQGHIDFGDDPFDYEFKLTFTKEIPIDQIEEKRYYWLDQMATYAIMRRRREARLAVLYLFPFPNLVCYKVKWTIKELADWWDVQANKVEYLDGHYKQGTLPERTTLSWLCNSCELRRACYEYERDN